jgi:hypothetical protein
MFALDGELSGLGDNLSEETSALFVQRKEEFLIGLIRWIYAHGDNRSVQLKLL